MRRHGSGRVVASAFAWVLLGAAQCAFAARPPTPGCVPQVDADLRAIDVSATDGTGQTWLHLRNRAKCQATVEILAGYFIDPTTKRRVAGDITLLKAGESSGSPSLTLKLEPDTRLSVRVSVAGFKSVAEASAQIGVNGTPVTLTAAVVDVPFNVGLQTDTPEKPVLRFMRGRDGLLVLQNDDAFDQKVEWKLFIPGEATHLTSVATIPAKASLTLTLTPPAEWFSEWFGSLFRDAQRPARLSLRRVSEYSPPAAKLIPVQLDIVYWGAGKAWGNVVLFGVLALGAMLSMVANAWVPNYTRRADLVRRLEQIEDELRPTARRDDSRLRVSLGVTRHRIRDRLKRLILPGLNATDQLKQLETEIDSLQSHARLAVQIDNGVRRIESLLSGSSMAPPTVLERAHAQLERATLALSAEVPKPEDVEIAKAAIQASVARLDKIGEPDDTFANELAGRVQTLKGRLAQIQAVPQFVTLGAKFPHLVAILSNANAGSAATIGVDAYVDIDAATRKLQLVFDYIAEISQPSFGNDVQTRAAAVMSEFEGSLTEQSLKKLVRMRQIVEQLKERVFASDVEEALCGNKFEIEVDTARLQPYQPVGMQVRLPDSIRERFALRDFTCVWDFGPAVGKESGWRITHYFRDESETGFSVNFRKANGAFVAVKTAPTLPQLSVKEQSVWLSDRTKAEVLRLALVLVLAVIGLIVGAREQFMKLDVFFGLIAVLMLGFSADAIKNLFTKSS